MNLNSLFHDDWFAVCADAGYAADLCKKALAHGGVLDIQDRMQPGERVDRYGNRISERTYVMADGYTLVIPCWRAHRFVPIKGNEYKDPEIYCWELRDSSNHLS